MDKAFCFGSVFPPGKPPCSGESCLLPAAAVVPRYTGGRTACRRHACGANAPQSSGRGRNVRPRAPSQRCPRKGRDNISY